MEHVTEYNKAEPAAAIGSTHVVGWNAAKALGDEMLSGRTLTVEAYGHDWLVFRDSAGGAQTVAFSNNEQLKHFIEHAGG